MFEKPFAWDEKKNMWLKRKRRISFEQAVEAFSEKGPIWVTDHPKPGIYPGQKLFAIVVNDYVHVVPFFETETAIVLKTIYPSRKATKAYLSSRA